MEEKTILYRQIRAVYDDKTIRVYQAYSDPIADSALKAGTFVSPPFKMDRMTWIKPSFLWMMYRAGWGKKDKNQKRILAIDITRDGFEWALKNSCLSHFDSKIYSSEEEWKKLKDKSLVRIQWDPERDIFLNKLDYRSIQIGIKGEAVHLYVNEWIKKITEVTKLAHDIKKDIENKNIESAEQKLPNEQEFLYHDPSSYY